VKEFRETVVQAIQQESPETAQRIVARLKERRALWSSAELPTLHGGRDGAMDRSSDRRERDHQNITLRSV
jgi:hypothetical protein